MNKLDELIEKYMQFDKKTLAELLAVKELKEKIDDLIPEQVTQPGIMPINPNKTNPYPYTPRIPDYGFPYTTPTYPNDWGTWVVTCSVG